MASETFRLVAQIQHAIAGGDLDRVAQTLSEMKRIGLAKSMTVDILQSSKAGIVIASLKKSADLRVSVQAKELVDAWKDLVKNNIASPPSVQMPVTSALPAGPGAGEPNGVSSRHPYDQLHWRLSNSPRTPPGDVQAFEYAGTVACHKDRVRELKKADKSRSGPVLLWMSRDQRICDNWALIRAQELALSRSAPLAIVFNLVPSFLDSTSRAYGFMLRGLSQVEQDAQALGIPFILLLGEPAEQLPALAVSLNASIIVADFNPLRISQGWKKGVAAALAGCGLEEVDAHNVVPCWKASPKLEVGARTIRKKIHAGVQIYATPFPRIISHPNALGPSVLAGLPVYQPGKAAEGSSSSGAVMSPAGALRVAPRSGNGLTDWAAVLPHLCIDFTVPEVVWALPGERAAREALARFLPGRLGKYDELRNDPTQPGAQSNLSPWIHFGHISAQRILLELRRISGMTWAGLFPDGERKTPAAGFAEELIVRRELSDNFCFYNPSYDRLEGASAWAQGTLNDHRGDKRTAVYSEAQFEGGRTHEALWNAGQMELVQRGKLHGFMRMYWAKKILEWSSSPEEALRIAIRLNDRYNLDGRDPSGYVGCMWAIAGVHDMGWAERPVFGKIRYMNLEGCKRKFDVGRYIAAWPVRSLPSWPAPSVPDSAAGPASKSAGASSST